MIYLLRHGETEFNLQGRYQGWTDSPLTARGRAQARGAGALLAGLVARPEIWVSPQARAQESARILAQALPGAVLRTDARLRELSLGLWDGMTREEVKAGWPGFRKAHPPREWVFHAPQGEGLAPFRTRLEAVLQAASARPEGVVLVSHAFSGRLLRGLHAGLTLAQALHLDAAQELVFRLRPGGGIETLRID